MSIAYISKILKRSPITIKKLMVYYNIRLRTLSETVKLSYLNSIYTDKRYNSLNVSPNKKEKRLNNILQEILPNEYKFVGDFQFWLGGKNPDFMNVNGQKKIIELFGEYWHYGKIKNKDNSITKNDIEEERIKHFNQYGFDTLIIWENELKDECELKNKILRFS